MKKFLTPALLILIVILIVVSGFLWYRFNGGRNTIAGLTLARDNEAASYADLKINFDKIKADYDKATEQNASSSSQLDYDKEVSSDQNAQVKLMETCGIKECHFQTDGESYVYADISGYYLTQSRSGLTADGYDGTSTLCDTFVVTNSTQKTKDYFLGEAKNSGLADFYKVDKNGEPEINIDLTSLSAADKEKVIASSQNKTVTLSISEAWPLGGVGLEETPICTSFTKILKVQ